MSKYTFLDLCEEVFKISNSAYTPNEIWEKALEYGLDKKIATSGKTPWATIGARLYMDIKENSETRFQQISVRPTLFGLKNLDYSERKNEKIDEKTKFKEKDLHPVLVKYLRSNPHFLCFTKTINQSRTEDTKRTKNANLWVYSDLIGVYYPYNDFHKESLKTFRTLNLNPYKVFSFEMKVNIDYSNFKEYYFQAVSNSSWANEGYLVCDSLLDDSGLMDELRMLNAAHGIGLIILNKENPEQSEIVLSARYNEKMDIFMIDKLISQNIDVRMVFENINSSYQLGRTLDVDKFDQVLSDEMYQVYAEKYFGIKY